MRVAGRHPHTVHLRSPLTRALVSPIPRLRRPSRDRPAARVHVSFGGPLTPQAPTPITCCIVSLSLRPLDKMQRTAVIAAAVGYDFYQFVRFVAPLRVHYAGDVILFVAEASMPLPLRSFCDEQRVLLRDINTTDACHSLTTLDKKAHCPGFILSRYEFLAEACRPYAFCLSVDFRDVLFQADPFASIALRKQNLATSIVLMLEDASKNMQTSFFNKGWATRCGPAACSARLSHPLSLPKRAPLCQVLRQECFERRVCRESHRQLRCDVDV